MEQQVSWKKMYLTMAAAAEDALGLLRAADGGAPYYT